MITALYKDQELMCRETDDPTGLATCLGNMAILVAWDLNTPSEALPLAQEAYQLTLQHWLSASYQDKKNILETIRKMK